MQGKGCAEVAENKCGECLHFSVCREYTTENETFPEVGGCEAFKAKANYTEIKHGQWVQKPSRFGGTYSIVACSVCDKAFTFHPNYDFCPNCGADMREGAENDR